MACVGTEERERWEAGDQEALAVVGKVEEGEKATGMAEAMGAMAAVLTVGQGAGWCLLPAEACCPARLQAGNIRSGK